MGLIDILTQYDAKKKAAHAAKTVKHGVRFPKAFALSAHSSVSCRKSMPFVPQQKGGKG